VFAVPTRSPFLIVNGEFVAIIYYLPIVLIHQFLFVEF